MLLSIWIIAQELSQYHPRMMVHEGKRILRTARTLSEGEHHQDIVYVGNLSDSSTSLAGVICTCGHDIMLLEAWNASDILNEILNIFDRYNNWSDRLWEAGSDDAPQRMTDIGTELIKANLAIIDTSFSCFASSSPKDPLSPEDPIREKRQKTSMPMEEIRLICSYPDIWENRREVYAFSPEGLEYLGGIKNLFRDDILIGWISASRSKQEMSRAELDVFDELGDAVEFWLRTHIGIARLRGNSGVFLDLLDNQYQDKLEIQRRLEVIGIPCRGTFQVLCLRTYAQNSASPSVLLNKLRVLFVGDIIDIRQNQIFMLRYRPKKYTDSETELLTSLLKSAGWVCGQSNQFYEIFDLTESWSFAQFASDYATGQNVVVSWESTALRHIRKVVSALGKNAMHPAVTCLIEYDIENGTELADTLEAYLRCESNLIQTAQTLHIHRNTVVYRMDRIHTLTKLDLKDADLRLYLQLSFLMTKGCQPE